MEITIEELQEATKSSVELLQKKGHPYLSIVITADGVKLVEDKIGMPVKVD